MKRQIRRPNGSAAATMKKINKPPQQVRYEVSFAVVAPETISGDDIERTIRGVNHEFVIGSSRLFPLEMQIIRQVQE